MGYEEKIARVRAIIVAHNDTFAQAVEGGHEVDLKPMVDIPDFLKALQRAGGTSDDGLKACSWEDLEGMGLPRLLARQVAKVFREDDANAKPQVITDKVALGMTPSQLLAAYDPRDADNAVGKRLAVLAKGKRCVVIKDDGSVDVDASVKLLREIRDDEPEREFVGAPPRKTYRIGERPVEMADENPIYRGRALRRDGTCDQTNRSWDGVSYEVRALLHLAVYETQEVAVRTLDDAHDLMDRAIGEGAEAKLRERYPRASVRFDELKAQGNLPKLKVPRGASANGRRENPFGQHRQY